MPTAPAATVNAQLQNWFSMFGCKSYATDRSMRRAMARLLDLMAADGRVTRLHVVTVEAGKHAGRVVPVLVYQPGEEVTNVDISYAHAGILVFQVRA